MKTDRFVYYEDCVKNDMYLNSDIVIDFPLQGSVKEYVQQLEEYYSKGK